MGDIRTHQEISEVIIDTFRRQWPHEENYGFFELGNWLTDMSQFNDPYAFLCAKMTAWKQARPRVVAEIDAKTLGVFTTARTQMDADDVLDMDNWADRMFGRFGAAGNLAGFLQNLIFFVGCEWFRSPDYGIRPEHFEVAFREDFSKYFPHEHLDFPPWPHDDPSGSRDPSSRSRHRCTDVPKWHGASSPPQSTVAGPTSGLGGGVGSDTRRILSYLDDQIEYVAELLTSIEHDWIRVNAEPPSAANEQTKRLLLIRWGHASHAIEDFFFHSNFVEFAWASQHTDGTVPTSPDANHHRQRRNYYRRRRSPVWDGPQLSPLNSDAASNVYTGSFGGEDVYHTFADAMDGIPEQYLLAVPGSGGQLLRQLLTEDGRRNMADQDSGARKDFLRKWRHWSDTQAENDIQSAVDAGRIDQLSGRRLKHALNIDRVSFNAHHGPIFPETLRGPLAFFTHMLCSAQVGHDVSETRSLALDASHREVEGASTIGASAENIGCHSLMSKDSPRKPPLRAQAMTQAAWVACYVARILARRLSNPGICAPRLHSGSGGELGCTIEQQGCVDWLHLLQHFLCHPDECENKWHLMPLSLSDFNEARRDNLPALTAHTLRLQTPSQVAARLQRPMRKSLERRYRDLEENAEKDWAGRT